MNRRPGRFPAALAGVLVGTLLAAQPLAGQQLSSTSAATGPAPVAAGPGPFEGSVAAAPGTTGILRLSLRQAVELGLANNLGLLLSREGVASARGQRWVELARLLPNLSGSGSVHHLKESLAITGISLPGAPEVVGPFNFYDARLFLTQRIFDLEAIQRNRAASQQLSAARFSEQDARELVLVAVGAGYLQALAGLARVETVQAQLATAATILDQAVELHRAGVTPGIDELRARVEWLTRSQQLILVENDLAKQKLSLLRMIGLPVGQEIELSDPAPFETPAAEAPLAAAVEQALASRPDYRAALSQLEAARSALQAARAQRLPALVLDADYGFTGRSLSGLQDTYHVVGSLSIPIFEGGRIHGEVLRAGSQVRQREEELGDLRGRIEFEVRTALLDLTAAARELEVARQAAQLADTTLWQAKERFAAGISNNLEVVQAQQSVAAAHEGLVASQYRFNLAKLMLARATGVVAAGPGGISGGG